MVYPSRNFILIWRQFDINKTYKKYFNAVFSVGEPTVMQHLFKHLVYSVKCNLDDYFDKSNENAVIVILKLPSILRYNCTDFIVIIILHFKFAIN